MFKVSGRRPAFLACAFHAFTRTGFDAFLFGKDVGVQARLVHGYAENMPTPMTVAPAPVVTFHAPVADRIFNATENTPNGSVAAPV